MEITTYNINRIYRFCELLKEDVIKHEVEEFTKGYTLKKIDKDSIKFICTLKNGKDETIKLIFYKKEIKIIKDSEYIFELMIVNSNLLLEHRILEKRPNGFIYTLLEKKFSTNNRFNDAAVLVDLIEENFALTKEKLLSVSNRIDFEKDTLKKIISQLMYIEGLGKLKEQCDLYTCFSTHMNYRWDWDGVRQITDNFYPTKTYLNEEELTRAFDVNEGHDKLYRVYDLYKGVINERNYEDIKLINKGFLSSDVFDLKGLRGITEKEEVLIGESYIKNNEEYISYLKTYFYNAFGYRDEVVDTRESIINGITHQITGPELAKRQIEKELGISYEEFDKLDIDNHFAGSAKRILRKFKNKFNKR